MNLHPASLDLDKLHAEILPKANLPSDFGGVCESVDVLTAKQYEELIDERDFLLLEEKQAALELDWWPKVYVLFIQQFTLLVSQFIFSIKATQINIFFSKQFMFFFQMWSNSGMVP